METTLPLPFLVSVATPAGQPSDGLTPEQVAITGVPFIEATPEQDRAVLSRFLGRPNSEYSTFMDVTAIETPDAVTAVLNEGTRTVFVRPESLSEYTEFGARVLPAVSTLDVSQASEHGLLVRDVDPSSPDAEAFVASAQAAKVKTLFLKPAAGASLDKLIDLARRAGAVPVLPSTGLTTDKQDASGKLQLSRVIASGWKSDRPDGLLPTVVTDEAGLSLGLAYTSEESIDEALRTRVGVYQSRKRGLWIKGATSGDTQELVRVALDCDNDTLKFVVRQKNRFCHLDQFGCFGEIRGVHALEQRLRSRKDSAPPGSYTARLFSDEKLLRAKIMEEAEELCDATTKENVAFEAADLIYFALTKVVGAGVSLADVEANLDAKSLKVKRRTGNAKGKWAEKEGIKTEEQTKPAAPAAPAAAPAAAAAPKADDRIEMKKIDATKASETELRSTLQRPSQKSPEAILKIVTPIIDRVRTGGDAAVLQYTHQFEKATSLTSPVLKAPFPAELMQLSPETIEAIDISYENIRRFHAAQREDKSLQVETMPGVVCSRFSRPIERVGLYIPGGTAVLPSTALMLGVPAMVAGCQKIVFASPPRADGSITPEIVYVAHKVGAESIVLAGGAQAVAAMAYGTESVSKVDKILGPGNQFVTAAKMHVSNDTNAGVSIDMPAGPSEVLVVADAEANPAFVASDLLSQAEHGADSQSILIAVGLNDAQMQAIDDELHAQATALPRVDLVRRSIAHSVTVRVATIDDAMRISNDYAPEHLILQVRDAAGVVDQVMNAGSVFVGQWTPESVGDYSAGVNHSLRESRPLTLSLYHSAPPLFP